MAQPVGSSPSEPPTSAVTHAVASQPRGQRPLFRSRWVLGGAAVVVLASVGIAYAATSSQSRVAGVQAVLASYVGTWHVHGKALTINADDTGSQTWNAGPCTQDFTAPDVGLCAGNAKMRFSVNSDGSITGTYQSVWYTQPDGSPPPADFIGGVGGPTTGDTYVLKHERAHLLSVTYPGGDKGYLCDAHTSAPDVYLCGA